ncbi:MAG: phosphatase PAP2 family protein [Patescibacteria group bacterium]
MKHTLQRFDQHTTQWIVGLFGQQSRPFFEFMTMLGDPVSIIVVTIGVMCAGLYTSSMRLVLSGAIIPLTVVTGAILKMLFERARPLTEYAMNMKLQTFSFPSGHSSGSMIAYGLLAYIAFTKLPAPWNYVTATALMAIPLFVGLSRVYLGAHFPSDVIAGWLLGASALILVVFVLRPFS